MLSLIPRRIVLGGTLSEARDPDGAGAHVDPAAISAEVERDTDEELPAYPFGKAKRA
jgi:hypothetical protein